jgi:hypothetical protein
MLDRQGNTMNVQPTISESIKAIGELGRRAGLVPGCEEWDDDEDEDDEDDETRRSQ